MSVLIRGMEMPERCGMCFLRVGNCKQRIYMEQRPKACPLIEIPTPHGRLIDKDKLRHELFVNFNGERIPFYDCDNFPTQIAYRDLHSILSEQKTVIEAEGSEE